MKLFGSLRINAAMAFATAIMMPAFYSCNTDKDEPKAPSSGKPIHYDGLENVTIPRNLTSQIKDYTGFTLSFNKDNRTPNYVAWELLGTEVSTEWPRNDNFWQDNGIEGCPKHADYTGSGYDRGHMCPAADQKWCEQAMIDCFVMANMCPQLHDLNAGAWEKLEDKERTWAKRDSAIMIVAGPIYTDGDTWIEKSQVRVPDAFFKVLVAPYLAEPRGIAFVYPHMKCPGNMQDYATSIDEVEKMTGFDFFAALPDAIEAKIESTFSFTDWNK